jgi:hypothetical protein
VREVLPAQSAPQIPSAQDAVTGCRRATFTVMEVAQVLRSKQDDRRYGASAKSGWGGLCS